MLMRGYYYDAGYNYDDAGVPGVGRQAWLLLKVVGLGSESQLHLQRNQSHSCCCWIRCHRPSFLLLLILQIPFP